MIFFHTVTFRNFFSFGNRDITLEIDKYNTTLLTGDSGSGKSALLIEPITFALYGKPFRKVRKGDVVNQVNGKDCFINLKFTIGSDEYMINRGVKPEIFEIFKNGKMVNQNPNVRDYQKYLEEHILGMSYRVWCSIVVLGFANHTPFMLLSTNERRQVVDEVLGIEVFQRMYAVASDRARNVKADIQTCINSIDTLKESIALQRKNFTAVQAKEKEKEEELKNEIEVIKDVIAELTSEVARLDENISGLMPLIEHKNKVISQQTELERVLTKLKYKRTQLEQTITFIESNTSCPSCLQSINDDYRKSFSDSNTEKLREVINGIEILTEKANTYIDSLNELNSDLNKLKNIELQKAVKQQSIGHHLNTISRLQDELSKLVTMDSGIAKTIAQTIIDLSNKQKEHLNLKMELGNIYKHVTLIQGLLKEDGIKGKIVAMYLPLLTKLVNDYLEKMQFFFRIEFDDNFNETIYARFRDRLTFQQLSQGEQSRVNLAIILAWRSLAQMRNSVKTNILLLDELLDHAISAADAEVLMNLIREINTDQRIFVISHKPEQVIPYCDNVISVEKKGNFSLVS